MNIREAFDSLNLNSIPERLIDITWENDFSEESPSPENGLELDMGVKETMEWVSRSLVEWCHSSCMGPSTSSSHLGSWNELRNFVNPKALLTFINGFFKDSYSDIDERFSAIAAAKFYVNLLAIAGAKSLNVYNFNLFKKALDVLTFANVCIFQTSDNEPKISFSDEKILLRRLRSFLAEFSVSLSNFHFEEDYPALKFTIHSLVELISLEKVFVASSSLNFYKKEVYDLVHEAYGILDKLLTNVHGDTEVSFKYFIYCFLPLVSNTEDPKSSESTKTSLLSFIHCLLSRQCLEIDEGTLFLMQQMCINLPDKALPRTKSIQDIINLIKLFPQHLFQTAALWIVAFSHSSFIKNRLAGPDLMTGLLNSVDHRCLSIQDNDFKIGKSFFGAVVAGIIDVSSFVRSKCLENVSKLVTSNQPILNKFINDLIFDQIPEINQNSFFDFIDYLKVNQNSFPDNPLPRITYLLKALDILSSDTKANVRKNSLQVTANICLVNESWLTKERVNILVNRCQDNLVSVRATGSKCLTQLLIKYPSNTFLVSAWVEGVLLLTVDNDHKFAENANELIKEVMLDNITYYNHTLSPLNKLPWLIISCILRKEKKKLLTHACLAWVNKRLIRDTIFGRIKTHIGTDNNEPAWFLIVCLSEVLTIPDADFCVDYYFTSILLSSKLVPEHLCLMVLETIFLNWKSLKEVTKERVYKTFKSAVSNFRANVSSILRYVDFCYLYKTEEVIQWCGVLVKECENQILKIEGPNENLLCRYLCTYGAAVSYNPSANKSCIKCIAEIVRPSLKKTDAKDNHPYSHKVRAIGLLTLGKICLQDNALAKEYAPLFASILSRRSSDSILKMNTLSVFSDLCMRFASIVEEYLGVICVLLRDSSVEVRIHTVKIFSQLIQENYLKVNSPLIFYLLVTTLDSSCVVKGLVDELFLNILKNSHHIMVKFFVHSMYFFNNIEDMEEYESQDVSQMEKIVFSIAGENCFKDRHKIYRYILRNMDDVERYNTCRKICFEILEKVLDEKIPLDIKGEALLKDAICALALKEIRFETLQKSMEHETPSLPNMTKRALLTDIQLANFMETVIPVLASLKTKLTQQRSPLLKDLMFTLSSLMRDYKDEVNAVLSNDPVLAAEVTHDIKTQFNKEPEPEPDNITKELWIQCKKLSKHVLEKQYGITLPTREELPEATTDLPRPAILNGFLEPQSPPESAFHGPPAKRAYNPRARSVFTPSPVFSEPIAGPSSAPDSYFMPKGQSTESFRRASVDISYNYQGKVSESSVTNITPSRPIEGLTISMKRGSKAQITYTTPKPCAEDLHQSRLLLERMVFSETSPVSPTFKANLRRVPKRRRSSSSSSSSSS